MATRDFDWTGFRALARRLEDLVGGKRQDETFAEDLRRSLTFLYTAGLTMPTAGDVYDDAGGDAFWNDVVRLRNEWGDAAQTDAAVAVLAARIARSAEAAQDSEVDAEELADLAGTAAQGIVDVGNGLADGSVYFDEKREAEAAWEWSFGFDDWGSNALAALSALHELLWGTR